MSADTVTAKMLDAAEALGPDDIIAYLTMNGWMDAGPYGPLARLYSLQADGRIYEAVIPITKHVGDFKWRVIDLLHSLIKANGKEWPEICQEISAHKETKIPTPHVVTDATVIYSFPEAENDRQNSAEDKADVALSIKSRLESLVVDAARCDMDDLARFIGLAALAAEDQAPANPDVASRNNELQEILRRSSNSRKH
ncbi:hypothetical protein ABMY26_05570 [Azospirillum sp. HJ39]|uniref:hypothetical protein n=1 Tax=Azospirillum sp. HJ39 TaxID=3159496 RepID=UPI003558D273